MKNITKKLIIVLFICGIFSTFGNLAHAQSSINANEATLNASVNPNGVHTTAWFEWGTMSDLHNWNETSHVYVGATNYSLPVTASLVNLSPNTTYYYRVVTDNTQNLNKSNILSFNTSSYGSVRISRSNVSNTVSSVNTRNQNGSLSAGPIFGATTVPNTLFGWLVLILIIVCIVVVVRKLSQKRS